MCARSGPVKTISHPLCEFFVQVRDCFRPCTKLTSLWAHWTRRVIQCVQWRGKLLSFYRFAASFITASKSFSGLDWCIVQCAVRALAFKCPHCGISARSLRSVPSAFLLMANPWLYILIWECNSHILAHFLSLLVNISRIPLCPLFSVPPKYPSKSFQFERTS